MHNLLEKYHPLQPIEAPQINKAPSPYRALNLPIPSNPDDHLFEWPQMFAADAETGQGPCPGLNHLPIDLKIEMHPRQAFLSYQTLKSCFASPAQNHKFDKYDLTGKTLLRYLLQAHHNYGILLLFLQ